MIGRNAAFDSAGANESGEPRVATRAPGLISMLALSAWGGLVAGLLEVATIVFRKEMFDANHLYGMSRHFVWLIPVTQPCVSCRAGIGGLGHDGGLAAYQAMAVSPSLVRARAGPAVVDCLSADLHDRPGCA